MVDQPLQLQPFSPPAFLMSYMQDGFSSDAVLAWILSAVFAFWAIYTLVAIYHWLKYSHASWVAFPAIAIHLFVSFALAVYAISGTIII